LSWAAVQISLVTSPFRLGSFTLDHCTVGLLSSQPDTTHARGLAPPALAPLRVLHSEGREPQPRHVPRGAAAGNNSSTSIPEQRSIQGNVLVGDDRRRRLRIASRGLSPTGSGSADMTPSSTETTGTAGVHRLVQVAKDSMPSPPESTCWQTQSERRFPAERPLSAAAFVQSPSSRLRLGHATRTLMLAHPNRLALSRRGILSPPRGGSAVRPTANDDRRQRSFTALRAETNSKPTGTFGKLTPRTVPHASQPRLCLGTRPATVTLRRRRPSATANLASNSRTRLASEDVPSLPLPSLDHPVSHDAIVLEPPPWNHASDDCPTPARSEPPLPSGRLLGCSARERGTRGIVGSPRAGCSNGSVSTLGLDTSILA